MKKAMKWGAVALMTAMVMTGCSLDNNTDEPKQAICPVDSLWLTRSEQQLVAGSNDFAFRLFTQSIMSYGIASPGGCMPPAGWSHNDSYSNKMLSPLSITFALGMLNNGAAGEKQAQINKVLGFGDTGADGINDFCRKILTAAPALDELTKVAIANTIFMNQGYELWPDFKAKAAQCYDAEPQTRNFNDGQTMDVINQWASDHTEKMIEKVVDEKSFNPAAVSYLLNAVYFKGTWANKFDEAETREEDFEHAGPDKNLLVLPMMHKMDRFSYMENDRCQAVQLPYGNGSYVMTVLLPAKGVDIYDLVSTMTASTWQSDYLGKMRNTPVDLKLPRFETETSMELSDILSFLGMPRAFSDVDAEFPRFCQVSTYISKVLQSTHIKVNEEGTEAAAVTTVEEVNCEMAEPVRVEFHADRPFLYVISEQATGAIFFIGQFTGLKS